MTEPILFGFPISLLFLLFLVYSFLGWIMETCYCSILEKRFVARGFLYGPICPIYGVGVLMMICWFEPFVENPVVFYVLATVCMSAWEYLVGWFLEATTHIKYWDYSMYRFHLNGRICLHVCLIWGVLAYVVIFWIHPMVADGIAVLTPEAQRVLAIVLLVFLLVDAAFTIRELTLISRIMTKLSETSDELRLQLALGKAELSDKLGDVKEAINGKLDGAKDSIYETLSAVKGTSPAEAVEKLRETYNDLLAKAEKVSRHLRYVYGAMSSKKRSEALRAVAEWAKKRKAGPGKEAAPPKTKKKKK